MRETKDQRVERLRQEVINYDSYAEVARREGLTRERVRQIVGNGLTTQSEGKQTRKCIDCNQSYLAVIRHGHDGRCRRCHNFYDKHGQTWSREAELQVRRRTHCQAGHELTPENTYVCHLKNGTVQRMCRTCTRRYRNAWNNTPEGKARLKQYNARQYERLKANPELWRKLIAKQSEYQRRRRANQSTTGKDN